MEIPLNNLTNRPVDEALSITVLGTSVSVVGIRLSCAVIEITFVLSCNVSRVSSKTVLLKL